MKISGSQSGRQLDLARVTKALMIEESIKKKSSRPDFNSADFFFVSSQLALYYPECANSKIINKYTTEDPPKNMRVYKANFDSKPSDDSKNLVLWTYFVLMRIKQEVLIRIHSIFNLPILLQDISINLIINLAGSYMALLLVLLYQIEPYLATAPLFCLLLITHFIVSAGKGQILLRKAAYRRRHEGNRRASDGVDMECIEIANRLSNINKVKEASASVSVLNADGTAESITELLDRRRLVALRKAKKEEKLKAIKEKERLKKEKKEAKKQAAKNAAKEMKKQERLQKRLAEKEKLKAARRKAKRVEAGLTDSSEEEEEVRVAEGTKGTSNSDKDSESSVGSSSNSKSESESGSEVDSKSLSEAESDSSGAGEADDEEEGNSDPNASDNGSDQEDV